MKYPPQIISGARLVSFALLFLTQQMFAQISEDFSDGDFLTDPVWFGDDSSFRVEGERLRLIANPDAASAYLATSASLKHWGTWQIDLQLDFNPSTANAAKIYVISDQVDLNGPLNGYFVQIGNSDDDIRLYRQSGYALDLVIDGPDRFTGASTNSLALYITRTEEGRWDLSASGESLGDAMDSTHIQGAYFGLVCTFTSTRSDKFYFDNISYSTEIVAPDTSDPVHWKDIVINEIYSDPSPTVGLPAEEFIELYNRSSSEISLDGWMLQDASSKMTLSNVRIPAGEYMILTSSAEAFAGLGNASGHSAFPSLNNSGEILSLLDRSGVVVDSIIYSDSWFEPDKREGGWSLELIDPDNVCSEGENWSSSLDPDGGTPGTVNSVNGPNPDVTGPRIVAVYPETDSTLVIVFSEQLGTAIPAKENFIINPEIQVINVMFSGGSLKKIVLLLNHKIEARKIYTMSVSDVFDCTGNPVVDSAPLIFGKPEPIATGDVLINEILFNPLPLGSDFIELVNMSDKFIDLRSLSLSNLTDDTFENLITISTEAVLMRPHDYLLLTEDVEATLAMYPGSHEKQMFHIEKLPPFNDDEGSAAISWGDVAVDQLHYTSAMHNVFLRDDEGVSLERISLARATDDPSNWTSASSVAGFATPGYPNSNKGSPAGRPSNAIIADPEVFIPVFGQPDHTLIQYALPSAGYVGNLKIFDSQGRLIKQLASNEILGTDGAWRWEGDTESGNKVRMGLYMIVFQVFDANGNVETFKGRVAVASRL